MPPKSHLPPQQEVLSFCFSATAKAKPAIEMKNQSREQFQGGGILQGCAEGQLPHSSSRGRYSTPRSPTAMGVFTHSHGCAHQSTLPALSAHRAHAPCSCYCHMHTPSPCWKKLGLSRALKSGSATVHFFYSKLCLMKIPETQSALFSS